LQTLRRPQVLIRAGQRWLQERLDGGRPAIRSNNWLVVRETARAGGGYAILPWATGIGDLKMHGG
jgi:DNA-binding transcriptional LysR family regulator